MSSLPSAPLPTASLESLKFKATQLQESIIALQRTIEYGGLDAMPSWPDVLSKYNVLLSQSLNLSVGLVGMNPGTVEGGGTVGGGNAGNQFSRIALHPNHALSDTALDNDIIPLLRNQQTTEVLRLENETVRRLGEKMSTRGIAGVLGLVASSDGKEKETEKPTYPQVISELTSIRDAHDARVDRAVRAVTMLREKYDWKTRVEVEVEEPEELEWDPRRTASLPANGIGEEDEEEGDEGDGDIEMNGTEDGEGGGSGGGGQSSDEEDAVDAMVVGEGDQDGDNGGEASAGGTPGSIVIGTPGGP